MANVSPGVYTKIIDLSAFVQAVPSTIGLVCGLTHKGRDNELIFLGSRSELISEFGEPNISDFGKNYGQGPYIAYNHLGESGALYWIRCLPDDAAYANLRIDFTQDSTSAAGGQIDIRYISSLNSDVEVTSNLESSGSIKPLCMLRPIGRGDYYNALGVRITESSNPTLDGVYILDIYEKQSDDNEIIIESFEVSFDPYAVDSAGDSIFISYILETYSSVLRADMILSNDEYTDGYKEIVKSYDKEIGTVTVTKTAGSASIKDTKQDFSEWVPSGATGEYVVIAKDGRGNEMWGWLGASYGSDDEEIRVYKDKNLSDQNWSEYSVADSTSTTSTWYQFNQDSGAITYTIRKAKVSVADGFSSSEPTPLKKGSEGSLWSSSGVLSTSTAETLLEQAYSGILTSRLNQSNYVDEVLDTENIYFSIVYDAGYPTDVKTSISTLCTTRKDCVGILDNGDNVSVNNALTARTNTHTFNNYYVSLYEQYTKISDPFTGQDVWFSPLYHMSYILPRNDNVAELWFAAAGFNRAAIENIKESRYNPRLGQRDQMYLKQLNPIVKFSAGWVVWGQLTSQAKASALQDLNIVRLVLYCKRALEQFCRFFIFEQNDAITWGQVGGAVTEFLEVVKNKRGLDSYSVDVGATDYEKKTKTFHVNIILQPTRVVEKIELNFFIQ
jgi:hypothetical protein